VFRGPPDFCPGMPVSSRQSLFRSRPSKTSQAKMSGVGGRRTVNACVVQEITARGQKPKRKTAKRPDRRPRLPDFCSLD